MDSLYEHDRVNGNAVSQLMKQSKVDTMIGVPSWQGGLEPDTQICLDKLCAYNVKEGNLVSVKKCHGSLISQNRNNVIRSAIEAGVRYVLFVDTDMVFPHDAIQRFKAHNKPVVSALAFSKTPPFVPNMYKRLDPVGWASIIDWKAGELLQVDCIGGAFMLVDTDVFRRIDPPWFASPSIVEYMVWTQVEKILRDELSGDEACEAIKVAAKQCGFGNALWQEMGVLGEDYYFAEKVRRAGIPIFVDTSMSIGHTGRYTYCERDFMSYKETGYFEEAARQYGFALRGGV